ncbi:MAG: hypothetical protein JW993_20650 [Sedimentisphaerales bacterium]|nr:hypothetical protein [Sedimentisphaerales bacterium]
MSVRLTLMLVVSVASIAFCAAAETEPNYVAPQPQFEMSTLTPRWTVSAEVEGKTVMYDDPGSVRPQYMARIILPRGRMYERAAQVLGMALDRPLAQKLSPAQRDFLARGFGAWVDTSAANIPNHYSVNFYAVSEQDAKIMAWALIDSFAANAQRSTAMYQRELTEYRQRLAENQKALPEQQKLLEQAQQSYERAKKSTYPLNTDEEASQLAKELVLQMDRQIKTLDIDLAGVRGKLKVINEYLARQDLDNDVIETLEAQRIEQTIELSGLEARRQAIRQVRDEQQRFWDLVRLRTEREDSVKKLKKALEQDEERIRGTTGVLEHGWGDTVPPAVYQNKVILYRIEAKDSQD